MYDRRGKDVLRQVNFEDEIDDSLVVRLVFRHALSVRVCTMDGTLASFDVRAVELDGEFGWGLSFREEEAVKCFTYIFIIQNMKGVWGQLLHCAVSQVQYIPSSFKCLSCDTISPFHPHEYSASYGVNCGGGSSPPLGTKNPSVPANSAFNALSPALSANEGGGSRGVPNPELELANPDLLGPAVRGERAVRVCDEMGVVAEEGPGEDDVPESSTSTRRGCFWSASSSRLEMGRLYPRLPQVPIASSHTLCEYVSLSPPESQHPQADDQNWDSSYPLEDCNTMFTD